jgi:hypothetical protein
MKFSFNGLNLKKNPENINSLDLILSDILIFLFRRIKYSYNYWFTAFPKSEPALNFTTFLAAILIVFPVCGFLPSLAALFDTDQDPNPTKETLLPDFNVPSTFPKKDSNAFLADALEIPESAAIASINCVLFIRIDFILLLIINVGEVYFHINTPTICKSFYSHASKHKGKN